MAEAFANNLAVERGQAVTAASGGTSPAEEVNPAVVEAMAEIGIPLTGKKPKMLTAEMADEADRIITMGCGVSVESCPARVYVCEDWNLDDPAGQPIERVRVIRDQIHAKVDELLSQWG